MIGSRSASRPCSQHRDLDERLTGEGCGTFGCSVGRGFRRRFRSCAIERRRGCDGPGYNQAEQGVHRKVYGELAFHAETNGEVTAQVIEWKPKMKMNVIIIFIFSVLR